MPSTCIAFPKTLEIVVDEQRNHAILFAATLLSARKLTDMMEEGRPKPIKRLLGKRSSGGVRSRWW